MTIKHVSALGPVVLWFGIAIGIVTWGIVSAPSGRSIIS